MKILVVNLLTGWLKEKRRAYILYLFSVHHSQSLDLLDFFWHAVPLVSQISCRREATVPWINKSEVQKKRREKMFTVLRVYK